MPVYMIQAGEDGPVKIGTAYNPHRRLAAFQNGHFHHLKMLAIYDGEAREERLLHQRFAALRIRGEWFHFDRDMLNPGIPGLEFTRPEIVEAPLLAEIETFLAASGETPTAFGRRVAADPSLVADLRSGRSVGRRLRERIQAALTLRQDAN